MYFIILKGKLITIENEEICNMKITEEREMKKIWINKKYIIKLAGKWTTIIFSFLGFIGTFVSLSDLIPESWSLQYKILVSIVILIGIWGSSSVVCAIWFYNKKKIQIFEANNNCHVYVQYGDIFSEDEINNPKERRNIVIPVNRCFDTIVDNDLVSEKTLHGIVLKKLYSENLFDEETLNAALQKDLKERQKKNPNTITIGDKRKGNLQRYEVGDIAEISESNKSVYFFLALSTFDYNLSAKTTQEEYVLAMQRLIEYCYTRSQEFPVVMPLIGAGLSRTKNDERSILEFIVKLLKMNKNLIISDIHIIVRDSGKETIPITEL